MKDLDQWWHSDLEELRKALLDGRRHEFCSECWKDEDRGIASHRQLSNLEFKHHVGITKPLENPVFWLLGIGNYCNIRCIMCNPHQSTNYGIQYEKNQVKFHRIGRKFEDYHRGDWNDADLHALPMAAAGVKEKIHFSGGEPLLTPSYRYFLQQIENPANVVLHINTNLTQIDDEWISVLKTFKTTMNVSLEGIGRHNDYVRMGSQWDQIDSNIQLLKNHGIEINIVHSFGRTSLRSLPSLIDYCMENGFKITLHALNNPGLLSINSSPVSERDHFKRLMNQKNYDEVTAVAGRIGEFLHLVDSSPYIEELDREFWRFIGLMDDLNKMDYRETFDVQT